MIKTLNPLGKKYWRGIVQTDDSRPYSGFRGTKPIRQAAIFLSAAPCVGSPESSEYHTTIDPLHLRSADENTLSGLSAKMFTDTFGDRCA